MGRFVRLLLVLAAVTLVKSEVLQKPSNQLKVILPSSYPELLRLVEKRNSDLSRTVKFQPVVVLRALEFAPVETPSGLQNANIYAIVFFDSDGILYKESFYTDHAGKISTRDSPVFNVLLDVRELKTDLSNLANAPPESADFVEFSKRLAAVIEYVQSGKYQAAQRLVNEGLTPYSKNMGTYLKDFLKMIIDVNAPSE